MHDTITLIVAEMSSNAVRHGRVPGRGFHLRLVVDAATLRAEVTDTRAERLAVPPPPPSHPLAVADSGGGRGLLLVDCLATRWGWFPRTDAPGKTVSAECVLAGRQGPVAPWG